MFTAVRVDAIMFIDVVSGLTTSFQLSFDEVGLAVSVFFLGIFRLTVWGLCLILFSLASNAFVSVCVCVCVCVCACVRGWGVGGRFGQRTFWRGRFGLERFGQLFF